MYYSFYEYYVACFFFLDLCKRIGLISVVPVLCGVLVWWKMCPWRTLCALGTILLVNLYPPNSLLHRDLQFTRMSWRRMIRRNVVPPTQRKKTSQRHQKRYSSKSLTKRIQRKQSYNVTTALFFIGSGWNPKKEITKVGSLETFHTNIREQKPENSNTYDRSNLGTEYYQWTY